MTPAEVQQLTTIEYITFIRYANDTIRAEQRAASKR